MSAWKRHFTRDGKTSRHEYRRWLPLIVAVDAASLWALFAFGTHGRVNLSDFGWAGAFLFVTCLAWFIGWILLTAQRLRSADISRIWLIFAILSINLPVGDIYVNVTMIAVFLLTAVAALAPDRDPVAIV